MRRKAPSAVSCCFPFTVVELVGLAGTGTSARHRGHVVRRRARAPSPLPRRRAGTPRTPPPLPPPHYLRGGAGARSRAAAQWRRSRGASTPTGLLGRRATRRPQLRHRALRLRHAPSVQGEAPAGERGGGAALVRTDPRRARLPPRTLAAHHPPRPQVRQHLRQRQPEGGQDRRPRPRCVPPLRRRRRRRPHSLRRHAGVHGSRGVRGVLRRARRRLLLRHVRPRDGHPRLPLQRVLQPHPNLQASHLRDQACCVVQGERPGDEAIH
ncbi:hypothetical protein DAI22_11g123800 [Oryza sativa Japonica Group]|uniref:Expressed protein n=2 Tax=Oryza sativa subsp. japonica TaxID=39947 RepID=Q53KH9_ORYSJ|nr:PKSA putative O-methyltransferase [Oryza sativa Japonica Group]ABA93404.2 expressed protein [Oryza sativa Japonica Group]KAF2910732.1 hypothetical protein DAI22_11g123800 [Oryza sativa Japonica Group]